MDDKSPNPDLKEAARLLGRIRSEKKVKSSRQNLEKAREMLASIRKFKKERSDDNVG